MQKLPPNSARLALAAVAALGLAVALPRAADADSCAPRLRPAFGDTMKSVAARCHVTVEALKSRNPGLNQQELLVGEGVNVPRPALPSRQIEVGGNRGIVSRPQPAFEGPHL